MLHASRLVRRYLAVFDPAGILVTAAASGGRAGHTWRVCESCWRYTPVKANAI